MPQRREDRTTIGSWLVGDLVARYGIDPDMARSLAVVVLRAVREDMRHAAKALGVSPALGTAARTLAARLGYALQRLGDPAEVRRTALGREDEGSA